MLDLTKIYHVGLVVPDLEAAVAEHRRLGVAFADPIEGRRMAEGPDGPIDMDVHACYAQPPVALEIVQEMPGTLWQPGERGRLHHLALRTDDFEAESAALEASGWPRVAWSDLGWVYHQSPFGYYVELISPELLAVQAEMMG